MICNSEYGIYDIDRGPGLVVASPDHTLFIDNFAKEFLSGILPGAHYRELRAPPKASGRPTTDKAIADHRLIRYSTVAKVISKKSKGYELACQSLIASLVAGNLVKMRQGFVRYGV